MSGVRQFATAAALVLAGAPACAPKAVPRPAATNAGLDALVHDAVVERSCRELSGTYFGLPSPTQPGATGGTWLIEECRVTDLGPAVDLELAGLAWEGERRREDLARFDEPVAVRLRGGVRSELRTDFDPWTGVVRVVLEPGAPVRASARAIGPITARPKGFISWVFDLVGVFEPMARDKMRERGTSEMQATLTQGVTVFFDPRGLQLDPAPGILLSPRPRPFPSRSWVLNDQVLLGRHAVLVRGPFPPSAFVGVTSTVLHGQGTVATFCAEALGGMSAALTSAGAVGADQLVRTAMGTAAPTPLGVTRPSQALACPWVVAVASGPDEVLANLLVTREPS